ncbi:hypothetical protein EI94DRAFT_99219 [Lactarius quietus]|nr:hypothetical protein EI94DRAFT_99219 [Lactarius quietus]
MTRSLPSRQSGYCLSLCNLCTPGHAIYVRQHWNTYFCPAAGHEQFDPYSFVKYIRDIGRAYQRQAIEIVTICRTFVQVSPQAYQHETKFKEAILAVDMALRLATEAGKKVTVAASKAFAEAQEKLVQYEESAHPRPSIANIATRMTQAKATDQRSLRLFNRLKAKCGIDVKTPNISSTQHINFVLLKSPVPDPKSLIVHQVFSSIQPMTSEILWNFSRYTDDRRIALRQNPHFYLNLPDAYGAGFFKDPTKDFVLKRNDTVIVYVLVDKPDLGRVYLEAEKRRVFGNVWMPNDVMIFKGEPNLIPSE